MVFQGLPRAVSVGLVATLAATLLGCSTTAPLEVPPSDQMAFAAKMARRGYWREARFRWEKVARERPDDARVWNDLAVASESLGNFDDALMEYKRALELDPTNRKILENYTRFAEFYSDYARGPSEVLEEAPEKKPEDTPFGGPRG